MIIRVKYHNDKFDMAKPWLLDRLIKANQIQAFCRKTGWVLIGMDKMRGICDSNYKYPERRKKESFNPFFFGVSIFGFILSVPSHEIG